MSRSNGKRNLSSQSQKSKDFLASPQKHSTLGEIACGRNAPK
jgi:hypothetical protein